MTLILSPDDFILRDFNGRLGDPRNTISFEIAIEYAHNACYLPLFFW